MKIICQFRLGVLLSSSLGTIGGRHLGLSSRPLVIIINGYHHPLSTSLDYIRRAATSSTVITDGHYHLRSTLTRARNNVVVAITTIVADRRHRYSSLPRPRARIATAAHHIGTGCYLHRLPATSSAMILRAWSVPVFY